MMYLLMMIFMLYGFIAPVCAGEMLAIPVSKKINISVRLDEANPRLVYISSKDIEQIEKFNIKTWKNEPFFYVKVCNWKIENNNEMVTNIVNELEGINMYLPFRYFVKNNDNYKSLGSQLFSSLRTVNKDLVEVVINLNSDITEYWPKSHMECFRFRPHCYPEDKEELLAAGIISEKNGKIVHGPNGCFPQESLKQIQNGQEKSSYRSFFSFKNLCRISIPIIVLYALYKKFYTAAS
ncbi:MAG TPA: hypothetical protein VKR54_01630 [Candidatus Babeliales bacterium]|nr:hypothetical protein [Candidatus Babeliales bacterium]